MTRFWLIRHGAHDWLGKELVGRRAGVSLNAQGREEAERIVRALAEVPLAAIFASPLERTVETATPLATNHGLVVQTDVDLLEVDFGEWTGRSFAELENDPRWREWNRSRRSAAGAGGERMIDVQRRIVSTLDRMARAHADEDVALVSHGDVLRAALARSFDLSLNLLHTIEFEPGAIALVEWEPRFSRVLWLSSNPELDRGKPLPAGRACSAQLSHR